MRSQIVQFRCCMSAMIVIVILLLSLTSTAHSQCEEWSTTGAVNYSEDRFGYRVAIEGNFMAVADYNYETGLVYLYQNINGAWTNILTHTPPDTNEEIQFGVDVDMDQGSLIVGTGYDIGFETVLSSERSGTIYIFDPYSFVTKLTPPEPGTTYNFGRNNAISGNVLASHAGPGGHADGVIYVYRKSGSVWDWEARIEPSETASFQDYFGKCFDVSGDYIAAASYGLSTIWIFHFDGTDWIEEARIDSAEEIVAWSAAGTVAIDGDLLAFTTADEDSVRSVHVYRRSGISWTEEAVFSTGGYDAFGSNLTIENDKILVSAKNEDLPASSGGGTVYLYEYDGTGWGLRSKLVPSYTDVGHFGRFSTFQGSNIVVTGTHPSVPGVSDSYYRVYLFDTDPPTVDCNGNGVDDACEMLSGHYWDCNGNGQPDDCDILDGISLDCNDNMIPDECIERENDCNSNGYPDKCDIADETSVDCNSNLIPDECIWLEVDCNNNLSPDTCDIADVTSIDCQSDGIPDECVVATPDCNANGIADECDISSLASSDCNANNIPDECDISSGASSDCNSNGLPDSCDPDCNNNSTPDACDIADGTSIDVNMNGIPDECDIDCNINGVVDSVDLQTGTSVDCDRNGIPDECDECDTEDCLLNYPPPVPCCPFSQSPAVSVVSGGSSNQLVLTSNRFLILRPRNAGEIKAIRVRFVDLPAPFNSWNGHSLWVGSPSDVSEHGSSVAPMAGFGTFKASSLQCSPLYRDWGAEPILHVIHEGIVPGGSYQVDVIDIGCDPLAPVSFSAAVNMECAKWGDTLSDLTTTPPGPPNGITSILDVLGILGRFKSEPDAISKARADMEPGCIDLRINITDVVAAVNAFSSMPYPFAPTAADPCNSICANPLP